MKKVVIAGGGIGGLSAAHLLAGKPSLFEVHLYERSDACGGKAASQDAEVQVGLGTMTAPHLGEHGFRFFPWFYRHLAAMFKEIPLPAGTNAFEALEECTDTGVALGGKVHLIPRGSPSVIDFFQAAQTMFGALGASLDDVARLAGVMLKFHTSCHLRRAAVYEHISWSDYAGFGSGAYDPDFVRMAEALPMMLVAMRASEGSAKTLGNVGQQMVIDFDTVSYDKVDAVLQGPTSEVWIDPWVEDLKARGVIFHMNHELLRIELVPAPAPGHVEQMVFRDPAGSEVSVDVSAGHAVCALPIDAMGSILTPELAGADPDLQQLSALVAEEPWGDMIGVQYFLDRDVPMLKGHAAYPESDWALTSVSQAQFWRAGPHIDADLAAAFGVPGLKGVLSVIVSDWSAKVTDAASPVWGKSASQLSSDQIQEEIWRQLVKAAFPNPALAPNRIDSHLDEGVEGIESGGFVNPTPLLLHPPSSYPKRPRAALSRIDNLVLAADYVRTHTELATMEGANEAARRAVQAIFNREGIGESTGVFPLEEGSAFDWARELDCWLFVNGYAHLADLVTGATAKTSVDAIPVDAESFDVRLFGRLPPTEIDPWFDAPRTNARKVAEEVRIGPERPMVHLEAAKLAYAPFPTPGDLPVELELPLRRMYENYYLHEERLRRFTKEPTERSYRLWHALLEGREV